MGLLLGGNPGESAVLYLATGPPCMGWIRPSVVPSPSLILPNESPSLAMARNTYRDDDQDAFSASAGAGGDDLLGDDDLFGGAMEVTAPPTPKAGVGSGEDLPIGEETAATKSAKKPRKKKGEEAAEAPGEPLSAEVSAGVPVTESVPPIAPESVPPSPSEVPALASSAPASTQAATPAPATSPAPAPAREKTPDGPLRSAAPRQVHTPDGYVVVARRYRPQTFGELVGQEAVRNSLCGAIEQGRVGHAFLFSGPRGTGKTSTARILAKALNCMENGPRPDPCGTCPSCLSIASGSSLDVIEIDAASNTGVDNIRDLRSGVALAPFSRYKVYIIDEVHMLSTGAFNALLKTLEEPPGQVVFVLATTEIHKVPETIVSRCQSFQFRRFSEDELTGQLGYIFDTELNRRSVVVDPEDRRKILDLLARSADGGMRDAQVLLDQILVLATDHLDYETVRRFVGAVDTGRLDGFVGMLHDRKTPELLEFVGELVDAGQDLEVFTKALLDECRNLLVLKAAPQSEGLVVGSPERLAECVTLAARLPVAFLVDLSEQAVALTEAMKTAANPRFLLELFVVRLSRIRPVDDLDRILKRVDDLEKALKSGGAVAGGGGSPIRNEAPTAPAAMNEPSREEAPAPFTRAELTQADPVSREESSASAPPPVPSFRAGEGSLKDQALSWVAANQSLATKVFEACEYVAQNGRLMIQVSRSYGFGVSKLEMMDKKGQLHGLAQALLGAQSRAQLVVVDGEPVRPAPAREVASPSMPSRAAIATPMDDGGSGDSFGSDDEGESYSETETADGGDQDHEAEASIAAEMEAYYRTQAVVLRGAEAMKVIKETPDLKELVDIVRAEVGIDESGVELRVDGRAA
jgi:DNA polymerase-3 subunit gamma/tau